MWILVSQLTRATAEDLLYADHSHLLGFHVCSVFGLSHLRGMSQQTQVPRHGIQIQKATIT
jgi:hypothetical protein